MTTKLRIIVNSFFILFLLTSCSDELVYEKTSDNRINIEVVGQDSPKLSSILKKYIDKVDKIDRDVFLFDSEEIKTKSLSGEDFKPPFEIAYPFDKRDIVSFIKWIDNRSL